MASVQQKYNFTYKNTFEERVCHFINMLLVLFYFVLGSGHSCFGSHNFLMSPLCTGLKYIYIYSFSKFALESIVYLRIYDRVGVELVL